MRSHRDGARTRRTPLAEAERATRARSIRRDVDTSIRELARRQQGCVTAAQAGSLGLSPAALSRRAQGGRLERLGPRVYAVPDLVDRWTLLAAVQLRCPAAVASHRAAATLLGLDGVDGVHLDVTVPPSVRLRGAGVHRSTDLLPHDVVMIDGLNSTGVARTLCDLGAVCTSDVREQALESALRRREVSVARLHWRLADLARNGRAGPASLRDLLARRGDGPATESLLETLFVQCLRAARVEEPVRQHTVRDERGRFVARVDLAYPHRRIVIELDGWEHHSTRYAFQKDRRRQNAVVALGWTVLRFTWDDVARSPAATTSLVRSALA